MANESINRVGFIRIGGKYHATYQKESLEGYSENDLFALRELWDRQLEMLNEIINELPE